MLFIVLVVIFSAISQEYANSYTCTSSGRQEFRLFSTIFLEEDEKISVNRNWKPCRIARSNLTSHCPRILLSCKYFEDRQAHCNSNCILRIGGPLQHVFSHWHPDAYQKWLQAAIPSLFFPIARRLLPNTQPDRRSTGLPFVALWELQVTPGASTSARTEVEVAGKI